MPLLQGKLIDSGRRAKYNSEDVGANDTVYFDYNGKKDIYVNKAYVRDYAKSRWKTLEIQRVSTATGPAVYFYRMQRLLNRSL